MGNAMRKLAVASRRQLADAHTRAPAVTLGLRLCHE
ncbi:MAG: hypothetical protein GEU78_16940 [Actinobacteria bacterium]|nr:hypothetical protein [Actinomycetota bacterium]